MAAVAGQVATAGRIPGERIATTEAIADSVDFTTTETTVMSVSAPLVAGRTYRVTACARYASDTSGDNIQARMREDNSSGAQIGFDIVYDVPAAATGDKIYIESEFLAAATDSKTFVLTGQRQSGTGNCRLEAASNRPVYLYVEYIRG